MGTAGVASMSEAADRQLAARFHAGGEASIRELYERFSGPIHTVAASILADRELVADAVQQTFVKAWQAADRYDPTRPLGPWLYAIARRVAIDIYRRESRPTQAGHDAETDVSVDPPDIEKAWTIWEVRQAIDRLDPIEQEVVRLSHLEGYSHPEIAAQLGVPVGTIKSRSHRAHKRLAQLLSHVVSDGP